MKFVSFETQGRASYGALDSERIIDLGARFSSQYADLRAVLEADALPDMMAAASNAATSLAPGEVRLLPVIPNPRKILCVGLNYKPHLVEMNHTDAGFPAIFVRFADTLVADGAALLRPMVSQAFDYEGELALIIGKGGRRIGRADAARHIAGFACFNDASVRDWQRHTHQWTPGKNFPCTGAFGPAMATAGEIADLDALTLSTRLNGQLVQQASLADLIFTIPELIEYLSAFTMLNPGDVIATGTPGGVGDRRQPPLYMQPGDVVEVEIDEVGVLRNTVQDEQPDAAPRAAAKKAARAQH